MALDKIMPGKDKMPERTSLAPPIKKHFDENYNVISPGDNTTPFRE